MTVRAVLEVGAILGEGPVWVGNALWFVDIKGKRIYRYDPEASKVRHWDAPEQVGWVLPSIRGDMVAGLKNGLHRFDPATGQFALLHAPESDRPGNRLNDATTDMHGRLWFGSMDDGERDTSGRLYRCIEGTCADSGLPAVAITNGPAISPDGRTLFHTDTLGKRIWRATIDGDGTLGEPTLHITIDDDAGYPDGSVIDAEGCLWVAMFGGWGVRRFDPEGRQMAFVSFPCANITKIAFGGEGLRTAYATTARKGLDSAALSQQPLAGSLFAFEPGTAGLPVTPAII